MTTKAKKKTTPRLIQAGDPLERPLTTTERVALSYAARILYTIPIQEWSNASDMLDMIEGKSCGRDGYILSQALRIWEAPAIPTGHGRLFGVPMEDPEAKTFWEKFISENVAAVRAVEAAEQAEADAKARAAGFENADAQWEAGAEARAAAAKAFLASGRRDAAA